MYCVVHYVWFCEFWMQVAIASIVHLYVFLAKPYELIRDCFLESISVLVDYYADCPYEFDVMFKLFIFHKVSVLHSGNFVYWVCYFFVICLRWSDILLWQLLPILGLFWMIWYGSRGIQFYGFSFFHRVVEIVVW